jgi:hypothetical protein
VKLSQRCRIPCNFEGEVRIVALSSGVLYGEDRGFCRRMYTSGSSSDHLRVDGFTDLSRNGLIEKWKRIWILAKRQMASPLYLRKTPIWLFPCITGDRVLAVERVRVCACIGAAVSVELNFKKTMVSDAHSFEDRLLMLKLKTSTSITPCNLTRRPRQRSAA